MEEKRSGREVQRLETRERVYKAAIAEFKRSGMADADIGVITAAAGVARGTFYFHFPTKEHVLAELVHREEARMSTELARFLVTPRDLASTLAEEVRLIVGVERRLGKVLFREMLAFHFSPTRPEAHPDPSQWAEHPAVALMVEVIERARERGEVHAEADAVQSVSFFLLGLYALLITSHDYSKSARAGLLDSFVATAIRGLEPRSTARGGGG